MSDHSISCTIVNMTTGTMGLSATAKNSGTELTLGAGATNIDSGVTVPDAFVGSNSAVSGCGGTVTYLMPNQTDFLVIAYNTSVNCQNSYCIPMLQSGDADEIGCDEYYCITQNAVSTTEDNGVTTTITVYDT